MHQNVLDLEDQHRDKTPVLATLARAKMPLTNDCALAYDDSEESKSFFTTIKLDIRKLSEKKERERKTAFEATCPSMFVARTFKPANR